MWHLEWPFGAASIRPEAAMLWNCEFHLPSGLDFRPFARAPWAGELHSLPDLPAHMRYLGGEFACVPFGIGGAPSELLPEWRSDSWARINPAPHGYSADHPWDLLKADSSEVILRLDYPPDDDIDFLTRRVAVDPVAPALDLALTLHTRRLTRLPLGLHPILRLPELPAQMQLEAQFDFGLTYPAFVPPGVSRVARGAYFEKLSAIPTSSGGTVDYSRLPNAAPTEEMLMLCGVRGPLTARYLSERAALRVSWDTGVLPSCLLWPSDRSLPDAPWNGVFRGLGVEPIAAVFDAAREVAVGPNPIAARGVATAVQLVPGRPLVVRYRIEAVDD